MAFPSLRHLIRFIPWLFDGFAVQLKGNKAIHNLLTDFLEEHKETFDPENIRDFIDAYLKESDGVSILLLF